MTNRESPMEAVRGLRIAHLIETDGPGGAERVLSLLASAFQAGGASNVAFLPEGREGWLSGVLTEYGIEVERYRLPRPISPGFAARLARRFREHRIDFAHSHEFTMAFYGALAARAVRIPHLITMHGGRYYAGRARRRWALRGAAHLSGPVIAVSDPLRRALVSELRLPPQRVRVIRNGVVEPEPVRSTLRRELELPPGASLAVSVGSLYPVKGHEHLVRALALLQNEDPRLHVAVAGRGSLEEDLRRAARELGVSDRLHLLGLRGDVPNVLAAADLFVLPSLSEGLPMALLEAMFSGVPAVATSVGEVPTVLDRGRCGVLVPPGDPEALAGGIRRVLTDPGSARELAVRARQRAESTFSVRHMVQRYAEIYAGASTPTPSPPSRRRP